MKKKVLILICVIFASSCQKRADSMRESKPPIAQKQPKELSLHGHVRQDNYYWLNNREDAEVISYLEAENDYYQKSTAHTVEFRNSLFQEMKGRIKEDDTSVPYFRNDYWYQTKYETGKEYPIYLRRKGSLAAKEEVMFDCNELATDHEFFNLRGIAVSPDNRFAAFGTDTISRRQYHIQIKDLSTGEILSDKIENTTGSAAWGSDSKTFFYTRKDPVTLRGFRIYKHVMGTPEDEDVLIYEEKDETFNTFVYKSKSRKYLIIGSYSTMTSEYRILEADNPHGEFRIFSPRQRGLEYSISHYDGHFYILTNKDKATNFKIMKVWESETDSGNWEDFIDHRKDVLLEDLEIFREYYVLTERQNGLNRMRIVRWDGTDSYYIPFDNETYVASPHINPDFDSDTLRYLYTSLTEPYSVMDINMKTRQKLVKKQQEVLGGDFASENYRSERVWATAGDGVQIPISLVYHKNTPLDGNSPLLQYGYGSYGSTIDPYFSSVRLSLLNRGFIFAIAHVRGGEYLGRPWYENGKLLSKKNSFTDFIDCSKFLIESGYTSSDHLYAYGASAGGLLMGAVVNIAPDLYNGLIAGVPFVDVVTTMLDDSIPLTTAEFDEWGNPEEKEYYDYMLSYSPYDNVAEKAYPHMLVTTGLHDSQVQYWEPAKWVAKLRDYKTDENQLFLDTNMDAGHGGSSGRFEALKETAKEYAFLLDLEGKIP